MRASSTGWLARLALVGLVAWACTPGGAPPETTTTTTTTTVPPTTTTTEADPAEEGPVGYAGCSLTMDAVQGYEEVGGDGLWPAGIPYGAGVVSVWADLDSRFWREFERMLLRNPDTAALWWQLCTFRDGAADDLDAARVVVERFEELIPWVTVFVSAQPRYQGGHVCRAAGPDGPARMEALAEALVAEGLATRGPVVGPLSRTQTSDGCHADREGRQLMGEQLAEFFGG